MNQTLKYCSFRLFFTILLFYPLLVVLGYFSNENLQAFMGDDRPFILAFFFVLLLIVSIVFTSIGKQRIARKLESLKRKRDSKVKETIRSFERLLTLTYSAFFTPLSGERTREKIIENFADLLATESIDEHYSRNILETAVMNGNASLNVDAFLAKAYINQNRLDDQELFCAETICLDKPNESVLLDKIVDEYLSRRSTGVKARMVFKVALMRHRPKSLEIVYLLQKDYLKNGEIDELGAWVFLVISENRDEFELEESWFQDQLRECYRRFGERGDDLAKRLEAALEREEASYEKIDVSTAPAKTSLPEYEPITIDKSSDQPQEMEDLEISIIDKLPKDFTRKESLPLYLTGAALVGILLFIVFFFRGEEVSQFAQKSDSITTQAKKVEPKKSEKTPIIKQEGKNVVVSELPFTIQLAALKDLNEARSFLAKLKNKEKNAYVNVWQADDNSLLYRIRIGFFKDQDEARAYATKLKEKGAISSFFISSFDGGVWSLE